MIDLGDIRSLTHFIRNAKAHVERLRETGKPAVLTVNGEAAIVVQDARAYQRTLDALEAAPEFPGRRTRDQLAAIARPILLRHGVRKAAFYGSRARGDHGPNSDVDLLIERPAGRKFSLFDLVQLQNELEDAFGLAVDIAEYGALKRRVRAAALKDEVEIEL